MSKEILLHICCGPCATATVLKFKKEGFTIVGFYYNPNIQPKQEYEKRLHEAEKLAREHNFELIIPPYSPGEYQEKIHGVEADKNERCPRCWELRLSRAAQEAAERGVETYASTLRISPYQDQGKLLEIGKRVGGSFGVKFYEKELTPCFHDSVSISKGMKMYRQKYCGCIFSKEYK